MSKFCTKCGKELTEDTKFCMNCGTKVENEDSIIQKTQNNLLNRADTKRFERRNDKSCKDVVNKSQGFAERTDAERKSSVVEKQNRRKNI